jgi:hypothetical protein
LNTAISSGKWSTTSIPKKLTPTKVSQVSMMDKIYHTSLRSSSVFLWLHTKRMKVTQQDALSKIGLLYPRPSVSLLQKSFKVSLQEVRLSLISPKPSLHLAGLRTTLGPRTRYGRSMNKLLSGLVQSYSIPQQTNLLQSSYSWLRLADSIQQATTQSDAS